jgi:hypothetical protein
LSHVREKITLNDISVVWSEEDAVTLARVIRGHPTITRFEGGWDSSYESMDLLYSALATLPALESITLSNPRGEGSTLAYLESLTELLRVPSLRSVRFNYFSFTPALCQAIESAKARQSPSSSSKIVYFLTENALQYWRTDSAEIHECHTFKSIRLIKRFIALWQQRFRPIRRYEIFPSDRIFL